MGAHVVDTIVRAMIDRQRHVKGARVLILGLAFKEDCADIRNTKVIDIVRGFQSLGAVVDVYDPIVEAEEVKQVFGFDLIDGLENHQYDIVVLAVPHAEILALGIGEIREYVAPEAVIFDVKGAWPRGQVYGRL